MSRTINGSDYDPVLLLYQMISSEDWVFLCFEPKSREINIIVNSFFPIYLGWPFESYISNSILSKFISSVTLNSSMSFTHMIQVFKGLPLFLVPATLAFYKFLVLGLFLVVYRCVQTIEAIFKVPLMQHWSPIFACTSQLSLFLFVFSQLPSTLIQKTLLI